MTLPTVVVCDSEEKSKEIVSLVNSQPDLSLVKTIGRTKASENIATIHPKLVWLELAPEPIEAIALLSELRGHNPTTYFLVSYETLNADLVKATMQLGAVDYLDAQTWQQQLPEAITRLLVKEKAAQEGSTSPQHDSSGFAHQDSPGFVHDPGPGLPHHASPGFAHHEENLPVARESHEQMVNTGVSPEETEVNSPGWPIWVIPTLAIILLAIFGVILYLR